jgi:hypothetical protein
MDIINQLKISDLIFLAEVAVAAQFHHSDWFALETSVLRWAIPLAQPPNRLGPGVEFD